MSFAENFAAFDSVMSDDASLFGDFGYMAKVRPDNFRVDGRLIGWNGWLWVYALIGYHVLVRVLPLCSSNGFRFKPFEVFHNLFLTLLSLAMCVYVALGAHERYLEDGLVGIICTQRSQETMLQGRLGFWLYVFYLSKYAELVDTLILAARQKKIIFLHIFHHTVVIVLCWTGMRFAHVECVWVSALLNSGIHVAMYTYYTISVVARPPWWGRYLTQAQMVQFVLMLIFTAIHVAYRELVVQCTSSRLPAFFNAAIIATFLGLFYSFYVKKEAAAKAAKAEKKAQ